jgi:hypothetical protein
MNKWESGIIKTRQTCMLRQDLNTIPWSIHIHKQGLNIMQYWLRNRGRLECYQIQDKQTVLEKLCNSEKLKKEKWELGNVNWLHAGEWNKNRINERDGNKESYLTLVK